MSWFRIIRYIVPVLTEKSCLLILLLFAVFGLGIAECGAGEGKMVEVILDASGSMNGKLKSGETKLDAAKKSVDELVRTLDPGTIFALRAYGHQSSKDKHDCFDTKILSGFGSLVANRDQIHTNVYALKAMGYSPITYVLSEAVKDFPADYRGDMVIVLISDGRETCKGDPCVLAQDLAKEKGRLVVHTIGFGADSAARHQLECMAKTTGGKYYLADDAGQLVKALVNAAAATRGMIVRKIGDGMLSIEGADLAGHVVTNAETGDRVGMISQTQSIIKLPAGIYNVGIGKMTWKSVEVTPGAVTVLKPVMLRVEHASVRGHKVIEIETGEEFGSLIPAKDSILLMPGDYEVFFGNAAWHVHAVQGAKITLNPGLVTLRGASAQGHHIRTMRGDLIDTVSHTTPTVALPPGEYTIDIEGKLKTFTLKEGENLILQKK